MADKRGLKISEVAEATGICFRNVNKMLADGTIKGIPPLAARNAGPGQKPHTYWIIPRSEVRRLMRSTKKTGKTRDASK